MPVIAETVRLIPGLEYRIAIDPEDADPIGRAIAGRYYEFSPAQLLLWDLLRKGDRVVDLGAHIGTFALGAGALGCRVLAVEAAPRNVALLEAGIRENGFDRVEVVPAAVSDRPGVLRFVADGPFGQVCDDGYPGPSIEVPAVTLDDLLSRLGWDGVDYLKIDVEGAEFAAFRGMSQLLSRPDAPAIVYESNGHLLQSRGLSSTHLVAMLETFGYRSYAVEKGTVRPVATGDLQIRTVVDYVAVKDPPGIGALVARAPGWELGLPRSPWQAVEEVLAEAAIEISAHRAYLASALARADAELLADDRVRRTVAELSRDADPVARELAARALDRVARRHERSDSAPANGPPGEEDSREALEALVATLELRLAERSTLLQRLVTEICDDDVLVMSWLESGSRPPFAGGRGLRRWVETTELTSADVETTMKELWRSVAPRGPDEGS
ncbi:MAG: FkbM family methyltransferase [Acidobacteriota bacterium]|nr:FkbM family methyltransferase [Acidobacteriota bacterium]